VGVNSREIRPCFNGSGPSRGGSPGEGEGRGGGATPGGRAGSREGAARPRRGGRDGPAVTRRCAAAGGHAAARGGGRAAVRVARKRGPRSGAPPRRPKAPSWRCRDARAFARMFSGRPVRGARARAARRPAAPRARSLAHGFPLPAPALAPRARPARVPRAHPRRKAPSGPRSGPPPPRRPPPARGGGEIRSGPAPPSPDLNHLYNTQSFSSVNLPYRSACPPPRVLHVSPPPRRGGCPLGGSAAARARGPRGGRAGPPPRSRGPRSSRSSCPPAPPRGRPPARAALSGASRPNRPRGRRDAGGEDQNVPSPPGEGTFPPAPDSGTSSELPPVYPEVLNSIRGEGETSRKLVSGETMNGRDHE